MSPVRIVDVSYVAVPANAALPPEPIKLTALEVLWVPRPVLQHVLLFEADDGLPPFDDAVQRLRSSLAATLLASFAPLAGKLVHLADTGDVAISCSPSDAIRFVVADVHRLATDEEHDVEVLELLVPEVDMGVLPTPVLAVQATRFDGGGVAVGVTVHHAVADGRSLWMFVEAWAAACRGETTAPPSFDRSLVQTHAGGEERARSVLRTMAPNLPLTLSPDSAVEENRKRLSRRTFTLDGDSIRRLKQRIVEEQLGKRAPPHGPPSAFVAAAALAWTCFARCKPAAEDEDTALFFPADLRGRLDPPIDGAYFGTCLAACCARLPARELRGERALAAAAAAVQDQIRRLKEDQDPFAGWQRVNSPERMMNVSGSPAFRAYEVADFGWGKPRRTEPVSMNRDGKVALMRAKDGHGVQVSLSLLQPAEMEDFKSQLLGLLSSA